MLALARTGVQGLPMMNGLSKAGVNLCAALAALAVSVVSAIADEAPTILIEDVIMTCTAGAASTTMPNVTPVKIDERAYERRFHSAIAQLCQGQTVCRISARSLMTVELRNSACDEIVIVPVCAVGAFESLTPGTSSEMTLPLRPDGYLVFNCSGAANPHF